MVNLRIGPGLWQMPRNLARKKIHSRCRPISGEGMSPEFKLVACFGSVE